MEVANVSMAFELVGRLPSEAIFTGVAAPFDKVAESAGVPAIDFAVDNAFDFVFKLTVDVDGRRWWLNAIRDGVGFVWFQEADMKDIVDSHCGRKLESIGV
jgi:hypothetical protein